MNLCPHCGQEANKDARLCPNCGTGLNAVWPPVPEGREAKTTPLNADKTQVENGMGSGCGLSFVAYFFLGPVAFMADLAHRFPRDYPGSHELSAFRYGTWTINLVPLAVVGGLYFLLRPRFPAFARGLGYCLLVVCALLLYGLATCRR